MGGALWAGFLVGGRISGTLLIPVYVLRFISLAFSLSEGLIVLSFRKQLGACGFRVQVGQLRLYENDRLTKVARIIRHPKFSERLSAQGGADIALLKLDTPVMLSEHVRPVSLPAASQRVSPRKTCWVAGWGVIENSSGYREDLMAIVSTGGERQSPQLWFSLASPHSAAAPTLSPEGSHSPHCEKQ